MDQHANPIQHPQLQDQTLVFGSSEVEHGHEGLGCHGAAPCRCAMSFLQPAIPEKNETQQNEESVVAEHDTRIKLIKPNAAQRAMKRLSKIEQPTARWG